MGRGFQAQQKVSRLFSLQSFREAMNFLRCKCIPSLKFAENRWTVNSVYRALSMRMHTILREILRTLAMWYALMHIILFHFFRYNIKLIRINIFI